MEENHVYGPEPGTKDYNKLLKGPLGKHYEYRNYPEYNRVGRLLRPETESVYLYYKNTHFRYLIHKHLKGVRREHQYRGLLRCFNVEIAGQKSSGYFVKIIVNGKRCDDVVVINEVGVDGILSLQHHYMDPSHGPPLQLLTALKFCLQYEFVKQQDKTVYIKRILEHRFTPVQLIGKFSYYDVDSDDEKMENMRKQHYFMEEKHLKKYDLSKEARRKEIKRRRKLDYKRRRALRDNDGSDEERKSDGEPVLKKKIVFEQAKDLDFTALITRLMLEAQAIMEPSSIETNKRLIKEFEKSEVFNLAPKSIITFDHGEVEWKSYESRDKYKGIKLLFGDERIVQDGDDYYPEEDEPPDLSLSLD